MLNVLDYSDIIYEHSASSIYCIAHMIVYFIIWVIGPL